ncbi:MAG: hypothetical protein C0501_30205 [Isosphaera sp.]|nr:hypothetical protein [Isosphaera sp.]
MPRSLALAFFAVFALVVAGCGSSNKDKIVGKWKVESGPDMDAAKMAEMKMVAYMDFAKDGSFKLGFDITDPVIKEKAGKLVDAMSFPGKYTVNGDQLELQPSGDTKGADGPFKKGDNKATIKFDGDDKLTLAASDGTMKLSRMK